MKPPKSVFVCQECGAQSQKWMGRCADCGAWNSLVEERLAEPAAASAGAASQRYLVSPSAGATLYADIETASAPRLSSGIDEFDRVLGGGIVPGSLILLGGEPGIGKSTLLLQAAARFAASVGPVLYASGEESEHQVKLRGERLGIDRAPLYLLSETCLERILEEVARLKPALLVVDSIQTVFSLKLQSAPGSIGQVREAATQLLFMAKGQGLPTFLVGHVTKEGNLAGPKALEHVVDTVLYFEGEQHHSHRIVRAVKNRFGAVSELGVFEMTGTGLLPVANPSALFLAERPVAMPGSAVVCCIEGSRPILVEIQALVTASSYGNARRMAIGVDQNRLTLLIAVLEKRAGLALVGDDVFVNVAGGMTLDEPAADLGVVAAVVSSVRNRPVAGRTAVFGEVGLAGEVRGITQAARRVKEAAQMGFSRCILPSVSLDARTRAELEGTCELIGVAKVADAFDSLFA
jgi:DNA repair protein RadA/Sms